MKQPIAHHASKSRNAHQFPRSPPHLQTLPCMDLRKREKPRNKESLPYLRCPRPLRAYVMEFTLALSLFICLVIVIIAVRVDIKQSSRVVTEPPSPCSYKYNSLPSRSAFPNNEALSTIIYNLRAEPVPDFIKPIEVDNVNIAPPRKRPIIYIQFADSS